MTQHLKEKIYTPGSELRNLSNLASTMWADLLASRELAWRLLVRNIRAQYRQSLLGYFWAFVPPLFVTVVWVFLSSQKIIQIGDTGMPYPLFVLTGTVLWQTFTESLTTPLTLVSESKPMLAKINFPREALILTSAGQVVFNFFVRLALLIAVLTWYGISPSLTMLLVPLGVLSLIVLGLSIGLLLTPLGILYHDVGRSITIGTQAWFFLTPVIYPAPQASWGATLINLNPVTPLLQSTRDWLIIGGSEHVTAYLLVSCCAIILLIFGWVLYRVSMPHLITRMSS